MIEYLFLYILMGAFGIVCVSPLLLMFAFLFKMWNTDFYGIHKDGSNGH